MYSFLDEVCIANSSRKVMMILYNRCIYYTNIVTARAMKLDIVFVFLPHYSLQFNFIEIVWKIIKVRMLGLFILYHDHLIEAVRDSFMAETAKSSYAERRGIEDSLTLTL